MFSKILPTDVSKDSEIQLNASADGNWALPEEVALFTAEFARDGDDLLLQMDTGQHARLVDYFGAPTAPDLVNHDGATLRGSAVERLAGPLFPAQYAQSGALDLANAIGQVEVISGSAFVQRTDGQIVELVIGEKVFQGDVVRTEGGSTLGLTFTDGTIFTLASGSRMVLDELIYDPEATDNAGVFDLVEGSFVFIAGQAAKTGGIEINTPAATMGIRGTTGKIDIQTVNGVTTVTVSLNPDPDGGLGAIDLFDLTGQLITTITGTETKWIISPPFTNEPPIEVSRALSDLGEDAVLLSQALAAYQSAFDRVQQGETFVELPEGEGEVQDSPDRQEEETEEGTGDAEPIRPAPLDETGDGSEDGGESGAGNPELDGTDEPILDEDPGIGSDDDAALEPAPTNQGGTDTADNSAAVPLFADLAVQSTEDTSVTTQLPLNTGTGETVEVSLSRGAENGLVVLASDGTFTYTPNPDFDGTDTFEVSGVGPDGVTQAAVVTVVIDPVNDAPVVSFQTTTAASIEEGAGTSPGSGAISGALTYVDVDEGAVPGNWSIAAASSNATNFGTIEIDPTTGIWRYNLNQQLTDTLTDGDVFDETFIATVTDDAGATDVSTVIVTVTGTNDSPVIVASIEQTSASLVTGPGADPAVDPLANTTGTVSGTLTYSDVDEGATAATWSIAADGNNATAFGEISITSAGVWTYTLDESTPIPLSNGQIATEVFTATVTDALGASAAQAITITITGTNDAPTIVFSIEDVSATVFEDGFASLTTGGGASSVEADGGIFRLRRSDDGELSFERTSASTDGSPDATGVLRYIDSSGQVVGATWSIAPESASLGSMTIDAVTGEWNYILDEDAADSMREGDQATETFLATITDVSGASASQLITITVIGTNDAATLQTNPLDLVGAVAEDGAATASGQLSFVDPDAAPGESAIWSIETAEGSRGSMSIDADTGAWLFTLDPLLANDLSAGEPVTESHVATVTDSFGATAEQTITITLTGQNDGPVLITGSVSVSKETVNVTIDLEDLGSDADVGEDGSTLSYAISGQPADGSALIDGTSLIFSTEGDFADLIDGASRDVEVQITATDSFGAEATNIVTVTVTGSDTGPVITSGPAAAQGGVVEAGSGTPGTASAQGTLAYSDDDATTPTSGVWSVAPAAATFGTMTIDATTGEWIYSLNNGTADALNQGQTEVDTFTATITDEDGQTDTQQITIDITGTNDAPVVAAGSDALSKNDTNVVIDLAALALDVDAEDDSASLIYAIVSGPTAVGGGFIDNGSATLAGSDLTFNTDGDFDALGDGDSRQVVVQIGATDARGQQTVNDVTITVNGTDSAPVITSGPAAAQGNVVEAGSATPGTAGVRNTLAYTDTDATTPTSGVWSVAPAAATFGTMTIDATTGEWVYSLNNGTADALNEGQAEVDTFTATITDENGQTDTQLITINITGSNDAPVVTAGSEALSESDASVVIDLSALALDVDAEDDSTSLIYAIVSGPTAVGGGFVDNGSATLAGSDLTFNTDGDFDALGDGDSRQVVVQIGATDARGQQTVNDVTITVNGRETGPLITSGAADAEGSITEVGDGVAGTAQATGTLTYIDDDAATPTSGAWSISADGLSFGTSSINVASGAWTYILNNTLADLLDAGDTRIETLTATITDVDLLFDTQQITITITGSNDAPTLQASTLSATEGGGNVSVDLTPFAGDVDEDDTVASLVFSLDAPSPNASIVGSVFTFDPGSDFRNLAAGETVDIAHSVSVEDLQGASVTSQVTVTVTGVNDAPTLTAGILAASEDGTAVALDLSTLGNDADNGEDGSTLSYALVGAPGNASILGNTLTFTPGGDFQALADGETQDVTVTVEGEDGAGATGQNDVVVTVAGVNDAPTLLADLGTLTVSASDASSEVLSATFFTAGLRADDVDSDDTAASLTYAFSNPSTPNLSAIAGGFAISITGNYDSLAAGATATETVDVVATDSNGAMSSVGTITWEIQGANNAPTMADGTDTVAEDSGVTSISLIPLGDDADVGEDGSTLTYQITGAPAKGLAVINGTSLEFDTNGAFEDLAAGASEVVDVDITATDGAGAVSNVGTVSITVTGANDAPTMTNTAASRTEDDGVTFIALAGADVDTGQDASNLVYSIVTGPLNGLATVNGAGIDFDMNNAFHNLAQGASQTVMIDVRAEDFEGAFSNTSVLTLTVNGVNDAPTVTDAGVTITEDTIVSTFDVSTQGQDVDDGAVLTYQVTDAPSKGTFSFLGTNLSFRTDGQFENLAVGDTELVTLEFQATDENAAQSLPGTFTYTITGVNDAPTMADASVGVDSNAGTEFIALLGQDLDDGQDASNLTYSIVLGPGAGNGLAVINGAGIDFDTNGDFDTLAVGATEEVFIQVRAEDAEGAFSNTSTLTIEVTGANSAPVANDSASSAQLISRAGASQFADTGIYYEFVRGYHEWLVAQTLAAAKGGFLATITSANENIFTGDLVSDGNSNVDAWLGASDAGAEGNWQWVNGPEIGTQFWSGDSTGGAVGGEFENWFGGQPNPADAATMDYLSMQRFGGGVWDDVIDTDGRGYLVEYLPNLRSGTVTATDPDAGDTLTFALSAPVDGLTMAADGSWVFDMNSDAYASRAEGEAFNVLADFTVTDQDLATDTGTLTLNLTGANDAPTVVDDSAVVDLGTFIGPSSAGWSQWTVASGGNGHFYQLINGNFTRSQAFSNSGGREGHMLTLTSAAENNFARSLNGNLVTWLGGSDASDPGNWSWIRGPEAGQVFWEGGNGGSVADGAYENWASAVYPLDFVNFDYMWMDRDGDWASATSTNSNQFAYIQEFSESALASGDVSTNDSDPEGDAITYTLNGTYDGLSMATDGSWTFDQKDPAYDSLGDGVSEFVNVYYTATDALGASSDGQLIIEVIGVNNAPVVVGETEAITLAVDPGPTGAGWSQWTGAGANDHYYQYIDGIIDLAGAKAGASGLGGHLATITSAGEQAFINLLRTDGSQSVGWLGGSDSAVDGEWRWVEGPEAGQQFWQGGIAGSAVNGSFTNWDAAGGGQPNAGAEDGMHTFGTGTWNNITETTDLAGYYLEYSGGPFATGSVATNDSDPDGDPLTYTLDAPVDGVTMDASGIWSFDRSHPTYAALAQGATDVIDVNYTVSDGTNTTGGVLQLQLTGINTTIDAVDDDLDPGVARTDEDSPITITAAELLANDLDPGALGLTIIDVQAFSDTGAELELSGTNIFYRPYTSSILNSLNAGQTLDDTFTYTIRSGDGLQTGTASVELLVSGLAPSGDLAPVILDNVGNGFASGNSDSYAVSATLFDDDDGGTGMVYKFSDAASVDAQLPDYLTYDPSTRVLSVDSANFTPGDAGVTNLILSGFEADGDFNSVAFAVILSNAGDIETAIWGQSFGPSLDPMVEIGIDPGFALGDLGLGLNVDLGGIDAQLPGVFTDTSFIDMKNGQDNDLLFEVDDLLNLIDGNGANAAESIVIRQDTFDSFAFETAPTDWTITPVGGNQFDIDAVPGGAFDGLGVLATLLVDDTP